MLSRKPPRSGTLLGGALPTAPTALINLVTDFRSAKVTLNVDCKKDVAGQHYYQIGVRLNGNMFWYSGAQGFNTPQYDLVMLHRSFYLPNLPPKQSWEAWLNASTAGAVWNINAGQGGGVFFMVEDAG